MFLQHNLKLYYFTELLRLIYEDLKYIQKWGYVTYWFKDHEFSITSIEASRLQSVILI